VINLTNGNAIGLFITLTSHLADQMIAWGPRRLCALPHGASLLFYRQAQTGWSKMIDRCRTPFKNDFSKLIKHGRGRRVDVAAEGRKGQADDRTLRVFDDKYL
jgi:hypothetical protein